LTNKQNVFLIIPLMLTYTIKHAIYEVNVYGSYLLFHFHCT